MAISRGDFITRPELERLAVALEESVSDLILSMPDKGIVVEINPATGQPFAR